MESLCKNKYDLRKFSTIVIVVFYAATGQCFCSTITPNNPPPPPNEQQELRERDQQIARERQNKQEQADVF